MLKLDYKTENEAIEAAERYSTMCKVYVYYEFRTDSFSLSANKKAHSRRVLIGVWKDGEMTEKQCLGTWNKYYGIAPLERYAAFYNLL